MGELGEKVDLKPLLDGFEAEGDRSQQQVIIDSHRQSYHTQEPLQNQPESPKPSKISLLERVVIWLCALAVLGTLIFMALNPEKYNQTKNLAIVRFLASMLAGLAGSRLPGQMNLEGKNIVKNITFRATGAFAAAVFVQLFFLI